MNQEATITEQPEPVEVEISGPAWQRALWDFAGLCCVGLGAAGYIVPGLPGTVFLIIACWCFKKGNPARVEWLMSHPFYGRYLRQLRDNGFTRRARITALACMWTMCLISGWILSAVSIWCGVGLLVAALVGTWYIVTWK